MSCSADAAKEKLLWNVKKEVKQIMEEAVTRKFVHEDSSHIIALCGVVEACLLHMLKRRAAGFLRTDKVAALFTKVGKTYAIAGDICKKVQELQQQVESRKNQPNVQEPLKRQGSATSKTPVLTPQAIKHIWVRTALIEKVLDKIVQYIVDNCSKYYEKEALLADPVCGPILASLLVGPCALEYTKLKTADHYWTDPSADELVQRHRIHGVHGRQDSPSKRPALGIRKRHSSGSTSEDRFAASAREYVESLHQNSRTHLLYGKNNVLVQPKDDLEAIPGYLSLHQSADSLTLKWTPNQLMNGTLGDSELEKSVYWDYALIVPLSQIVCIHCHQQQSRWTLVLVSQDGTQKPPLHFPQGGHLLAFLSCLENGLLPRGQLEPPLWSQQGKGKVFPKLRKRNSNKSLDLEEMPAEDTSTDYVFRIIYPGHKHDNITINYHHLAASRSASVDDDEEEEDKLHAMLSMICSRNLTAPNRMKDTSEMIEMQGFGANLLSWQLEHCSQGSSCISCSTGSSPYDIPSCCNCIHDRTPLKMLCESMKRQIVSRAFYGWLAYCRHLSTVRTHLSALVNHTIIPPDKPSSAAGGLTKEVWSKYQKDRKNYKELELLRKVYYGGVQHEIRKEVWPFLLGHYKFGMAKKEMDQVDEEIALRYQKVMAEWKACEVIVKQREKESHSATLAKFSSGSSIDSHVQRLIHRDSTISNDVFISVDETDSAEQDSKCQDDPTFTVVSADTPAAAAAVEQQSVEFDSPDSGLPSSRNYSVASGILSSIDDGQSVSFEEGAEEETSGDMERTDPDTTPMQKAKSAVPQPQDSVAEEQLCSQVDYLMDVASVCAASYTIELLDTVALNLHRIDKDVQRCDRNYWYFTADNLEKLRNVMCSYVWEHLEVGYVQGMCDLLAPLMVILDNDQLAYSCFSHLMKRMSQNFPNGGAMDTHFANMRSLIQILDSELFELMHQNGDYTHFYFCYRWFLLDFKRELLYEDVFTVWEVIWAAKHISSEHFVLFIALALVEVYREIIRDNNMDFTDIIKFFNEMAEHHNAQEILRIARDLVYKVQTLIENK
ncbi:small G protein signaling modulator 2 isoform X11 [Gallus gallus]|uniref:small G protein signaling modulator 2 isoform X11 n=1 Tax=Gallus gallus TaxID=9031 RepID=UPI000240C42C|nr:small G protein signaling modulator 2 isoform X11 [Gallus gallus]XP_040543657.1 small G protein signaling modulator 2 isoform X11 [Gallus gallus]